MRLSGSIVAPSLLGLASTAAAGAAVGRVYLQDVNVLPSHTSAAPTLSPDTARLVFAQRLGLSQYHTLKDADEDTIQYINDFGGSRHRLFGQDQLVGETKQIMVVVEGGTKESSVLRSDSLASFALANPPSTDANSRLLEDFTLQAEHLSSTPRDKHSNSLPPKIAEILRALPENVETRSSNGLVFAHIKNSAKTELTSTILELIQACSSRWPLTVVVMPPASGSYKRSASPWGQYDVPKRSATAERKRPEAILAEPVASNLLDTINDTAASFSHVDAANPLKGILPACFSSLEACESTTNSCSGRGSCIKKYTDRDTDKLCFTCKCTAQVRTNKDGSKKTTYYGGPACQKKDVVMPFWLFAGFAVVMSFTISWGIGLLYSMGNEELPSVIGAGVSGPSSRQ